MYNVTLTESYFPAQRDTPLHEITAGDLLRRSAERWPDEIYLREVLDDGGVGRVWTFKDMLSDCLDLAGVLAARHAQGSRVAIWAPNIPEWVMLEYALALAGVTLVTVNPSYQARELEYVLKQSRAEALYFISEFRGNPMKQIADAVCENLPAIKHRIDMTDREALWAGPSAPLPSVAPGDPVQIQYTSGTTGFPKGAVLHHFGLIQNAMDTFHRCNVKQGYRSLNFMPLFHTTGCAIHALGMCGFGCNMALASMFDPKMAVDFIEREKINMVFGVPTMIVAMLEEVKKQPRDFSSVSSVASGGSMVPPELAKASEAQFGTMIQIIYGQTETSPVITQVWLDDTLEDATETIGQPVPHLEVSIRNPSDNSVMPVGEQGEICARGYSLMTEYNDNPEATAATIDADGWLHTGDLGRMDARGYVKITGRVKEMIIRGGENLFPAEIENAILEHDAIAEAAVVGVPDEKWGEQVACFMRTTKGKPDAAALKAFIRERISPQKTPYYWVWVDEWPLTGSGKIQKFKLAEAFADGQVEAFTA